MSDVGEFARMRTRTRGFMGLFHSALHRIAASDDDSLPQGIEAADTVLAELEDLLAAIGEDASDRWHEDARERVSACRVQLRKLSAGSAAPREAVGTMRLILPLPREDQTRPRP